METEEAIGRRGIVASPRTAGQATTWKPLGNLPWFRKNTVKERVYFSKIGFPANKRHIIMPGS